MQLTRFSLHTLPLVESCLQVSCSIIIVSSGGGVSWDDGLTTDGPMNRCKINKARVTRSIFSLKPPKLASDENFKATLLHYHSPRFMKIRILSSTTCSHTASKWMAWVKQCQGQWLCDVHCCHRGARRWVFAQGEGLDSACLDSSPNHVIIQDAATAARPWYGCRSSCNYASGLIWRQDRKGATEKWRQKGANVLSETIGCMGQGFFSGSPANILTTKGCDNT